MPYLQKPNKPKSRTFNREDRQKIYQSAKWKKLRTAKLMADPLCQYCLAKGIITPATQVHHLDSFLNYSGIMRLDKAYDFNNLQSLCEECHGLIHKEYGRTHG